MNFVLNVCDIIITKLDGKVYLQGHLGDWYEYDPEQTEESQYIGISEDDYDALDTELNDALNNRNERSVKSFFTFERKCFYMEKFSKLIHEELDYIHDDMLNEIYKRSQKWYMKYHFNATESGELFNKYVFDPKYFKGEFYFNEDSKPSDCDEVSDFYNDHEKYFSFEDYVDQSELSEIKNIKL